MDPPAVIKVSGIYPVQYPAPRRARHQPLSLPATCLLKPFLYGVSKLGVESKAVEIPLAASYR